MSPGYEENYINLKIDWGIKKWSKIALALYLYG